MSSVKFEPVLEHSPDLRVTSDILRDWLDKHQDRDFIDPISFYREVGGGVSLFDLTRLLAELVASRQLQVRFRLLMPDDTLSDEEYDSPDEISGIVFDSSFEPVDVQNCKIVSVYRLPHHHE